MRVHCLFNFLNTARYYVIDKYPNDNIFRQACVYESAALNNPNRDIYIMYLTPVGIHTNYKLWPKSVRVLMEYSNVYFRNVRLEDLFVNTVFEKSSKNVEIYDKNSNDSILDLTRILLLFKYGGTFLDDDYITLRSLNGIGSNWISKQDSHSGMNFRHYGLGHIIAHECLKSVLIHDFSPINLYSMRTKTISRDIHESRLKTVADRIVGKQLIMQALNKFCNGKIGPKPNTKKCNESLSLPDRTFYAFSPSEKDLLDSQSFAEVSEGLTDSYGVKLWNYAAVEDEVALRSGSVVSMYMSKKCPIIFNEFEYI